MCIYVNFQDLDFSPPQIHKLLRISVEAVWNHESYLMPNKMVKKVNAALSSERLRELLAQLHTVSLVLVWSAPSHCA